MCPRVSIIIPTYNRSQLLAAAMRSATAQTFTSYEIIVVDDGSQEDIAAVVQVVAGAAGRCIRVPHGGPAAARNAGVQAARGELLAFLDSDDLWHPEHLAATVAVLQARPEVGLVYHDAVEVDEDERELPRQRRRPYAAGRVTQDLLVYDFIFTPTVVCRRESFCAAGGFDTAMVPSEDYDLWLRMSLLCQFAFVDRPLMSRRRHAGNLSLGQRSRNCVIRAILKERFWRQHQGETCIDPAVARAALAKAYYHAARAVWQQGHRQSARQLVSQSLRYRLPYAKAIGLLLKTAVWPAVAREGIDPLPEVARTTGWGMNDKVRA